MDVKYTNNMSSQIIVISSPEQVSSEIRKMVALFQSGLQQFHVRKPNFTDFDMINFITAIPIKYRKFVVLHSHYYLAKEFGLKGIQVGKNRIIEAKEYKNDFTYFGYSAHSFDEIIEHKEQYTHFFLSPIYNSISKAGYQSNFEPEKIQNFTHNNADIKLIALGGIDVNNSKRTLDLGCSGIALLGTIWQQEDPLAAYNEIKESINIRPFTLSIAGFDPCSGAGVSADIKTFEQHKVQGLGVNTAITYQNECEFLAVDWLSFEQIKKQIDVLFNKYNPDFVKIGLIENFEILKEVVALLKNYNNEVKIIWDPILKASADFDFHGNINTDEVLSLLQNMYLVTPNIPECEKIFGTIDLKKIQIHINEYKLCNVLLKGGHSNKDDVTDVLIENDGIIYFEGKRLVNKTKHGTGCVLSSAICSYLSNQFELPAAIKKAKEYTTQFIDSNNGLLGFHNIPNNKEI